uniref:Uncharacterized protein n=1 Tax=Onchocerca volvulus TaxID=6282 RepID=A0A8R1TVH1_ONCVO
MALNSISCVLTFEKT